MAQTRDLLPLLTVATEDPGEDDFMSLPNGGYTRLWIERVEDESGSRDYGTEARNWLKRFFLGRSHSRILSARLRVNRSTPIAQTINLATASHTSNRRQGESWTTELEGRRLLTPYFRVEPGTTATLDATMSASSQLDPDMTRNLLSIVERGARLAAPTAPLVTTLTSDRLSEASTFVDNAIARLFGEVIVERSVTELPAERWYSVPSGGWYGSSGSRPGNPIATVKAIFPMSRDLSNAEDHWEIGTWRLYASEPIVSIYSVVPLNGYDYDPTGRCGALEAEESSDTAAEGQLRGQDMQACIAFGGLSPSRVLALPVGENLSLGQALRGDSGVTAALQRFSATPQDGSANGQRQTAAREICTLVAERADALGLNAYDVAAALWAYAVNGGIQWDAANVIWQSSCPAASLARRLKLTISPASADQNPRRDNGSGGNRGGDPGTGAHAGEGAARPVPASNPPVDPSPDDGGVD